MATLVQQTDKPLAPKSGTLSALRHADFRLYFFGQLVSISGTWMQNIAQGYLIFKITQSELWLGIVACAAGLPIILMSPLGGVVVERIPRRRLLMITQSIQMLLAFVLTVLTVTGTVQVWHIVTLALLLGTTNSLDMPARQTFVVEMVGREDLRSGIALNSIMNAMGRVLGPTAAGIALVKLGPSWCFLLNGLSFLAVLVSLFLMKVPHAITIVSNVSPIRQLREGIHYARHDTLVAPLLLLAGVAGMFVLPIMQIFPAFAAVVLHSPEQAYAALSAAEGIGSVIGGLIVGSLSQRFGSGRMICVGLAINALATLMLALQIHIPLAVAMTGCFGTSMILLLVSLNTSVQMAVPDNFRSRVLSLYTLAMLGLAPFGALALGAIANTFGTPQAVALYGIMTGVSGAVILLRWPILARQRSASRASDVTSEVATAFGD